MCGAVCIPCQAQCSPLPIWESILEPQYLRRVSRSSSLCSKCSIFEPEWGLARNCDIVRKVQQLSTYCMCIHLALTPPPSPLHPPLNPYMLPSCHPHLMWILGQFFTSYLCYGIHLVCLVYCQGNGHHCFRV